MILLLILTLQAFASDTKIDFCSRTKTDILNSLFDKRNHFAFKNDGGLFDQGVCWWHSRFQRSATHLAVYKPDLAKPDKNTTHAIIAHLVLMDKVVEIPGYANFNEFTKDNQALIQKVLNFWQIYDGGAGYGWTRGVVGRTHVSAKNLKRKMNRLYRQVHDNNLMQLQVLQLPGIIAHAWIVIGMEKLKNNSLTGYLLKIVDSNRPGKVIDYLYTEGLTNFLYENDETERFVPYTNYTNDLNNVHESIYNYCHTGENAEGNNYENIDYQNIDDDAFVHKLFSVRNRK